MTLPLILKLEPVTQKGNVIHRQPKKRHIELVRQL